MGCRLVAKIGSSNLPELGSKPSGPAIYIDAETGATVTEHWWPGDPLPTQRVKADANPD